ncbi:MAG: exodeoxyribonuclease VII large subunit [Pseudomonadota bacterium]
MTAPASNVREYTVAELSGALKRTLEDAYGQVRVRGELGRVTRAGSGHMYLDLKDDRAVLSSVVWKGVAARLPIAPEQGMEVIATGKISTFPGQSRYQLIIDHIEPAGVGALMALLEERKKKLAAEGLFDEARKRPIPFLPEVIGVVTSPSGAVIRDILHRLRDRFPRHVLVWPTQVQGKGAEVGIASAIAGFNAIEPGGPVPQPDVLIVARGGGSLEDLWCFNEEMVARAAAASDIPLISAVGHETDTTLIDFAADRRAPTPTAAAEMAVPVRTELLSELLSKERRLVGAVTRLEERARAALTSAGRGLGRPEDVIGMAGQRVDRAADRLANAGRARVDAAEARLQKAAYAVRPETLLAGLKVRAASVAAARLPERAVADRLKRGGERTGELAARARAALARRIDRADRALASAGKLLATLSHEGVLARGFALVFDEKGALVRSASEPAAGGGAEVRFADGSRKVIFDGDARTPPQSGVKAKPKADKKRSGPSPAQARLFD